MTPIEGPMNDIVALDIAEPTTTLLLLPPKALPKSITSVDANDTLLASGVAVTLNVSFSFRFVSERIPAI